MMGSRFQMSACLGLMHIGVGIARASFHRREVILIAPTKDPGPFDL